MFFTSLMEHRIPHAKNASSRSLCAKLYFGSMKAKTKQDRSGNKSMRTNVGLTIYFSCPNCKLVYQTTQVHVDAPTNGRFDCVECGERIHSWTGPYNFLHWKPVTHRA
jgi:hypothetical protein